MTASNTAPRQSYDARRLVSHTITAAAQDVRQRYAGSYLGLAWSFLYPLALLTLYATVYAFIFKVRVAGLDTAGYIILISAGLMPVIAFSEILGSAASTLETHRALLLRTEVPAWLIPVRAVLVGQVNTAFGVVIAMIGAVATGRLSPFILLAPVFWVLFLGFMVGVSWFISLVAMRYRDIYPALGIIGISALILSPATYTPTMVPEALKPLLVLNPLTPFIEGLQYSICYGAFPPVTVWLGSLAWSLGALVLGFLFFNRAKNVYFDLL